VVVLTNAMSVRISWERVYVSSV